MQAQGEVFIHCKTTPEFVELDNKEESKQRCFTVGIIQYGHNFGLKSAGKMKPCRVNFKPSEFLLKIFLNCFHSTLFSSICSFCIEAQF